MVGFSGFSSNFSASFGVVVYVVQVPYDMSQSTAASSAVCRRCRQQLMMCDIVWMSPQSYISLSVTPNFFQSATVALSCLKPVQEWPLASGQVEPATKQGMTGSNDNARLLTFDIEQVVERTLFTADSTGFARLRTHNSPSIHSGISHVTGRSLTTTLTQTYATKTYTKNSTTETKSALASIYRQTCWVRLIIIIIIK